MDIRALARDYARRAGLPEELVLAQINMESGWNPNAVSSAGAMGLMQLMPATAQDLGVTDPYDVHQNLSGGTRYLAQQYDRFGDPRLALAAYNAGPQAVIDAGGVPNYPETQRYVNALAPLFTPSAPGPSGPGMLGPQPGALLGPAQPQGLLDRFAPGSGYGYDVALGIANTQGGPMTALAGGFAHAKDKSFERQMLAAQGKVGGMPAKTQEVLNLMAMGVPKDAAMRMAYPGGTEVGVEYRDIGGVVYEVRTLPGGQVETRQVPQEELDRRGLVLASEAGARTRGAEEAKQRTENREAFRSAYMEGRSTIPNELAKLRQLRDELKAGVYGTGYITGNLRARFDTALQVLQYEQLQQTLRTLAQVATGGLSNQELETFMKGSIGPEKTVEANIEIANDMIRMLESQYSSMDEIYRQFQRPDFDPLTYMPPMPEIPRYEPRFVEPPQATTPTTTPPYNPPEGAPPAPPPGFRIIP